MARGKLLPILSISAIILLELCSCAPPALPADGYPPPPGLSPSRTALTVRLERAEETDLGNSQSFSWSNPDLDIMYKEKAKQVEAVILRLEAGENVAPAEINDALDNSALRALGGYP